MIPSPKLDDREFADIVEEAISLIPRYAPDWTNHNPSDPGITLLELAAWMTDLILYRLNRVPEKNYIAFLNLLGIKLRPPRPARALLKFELVEGATHQIVPKGTQVATPQAGDEETITFETSRSVYLSSIQLDRCFSYFNDTYSDNSALVSGEREGSFEAFGGAERVDRYLYLSDPRFAGAGEASVLRIFLGCPESGARDLARLLEWEYWNGDRWKEMQAAPLEVDRGEICFYGPLNFEQTTVADLDGLWVRGRLAEVPERSADTEIDTVRARVEVVGEGVLPERAFANVDDNAFILLDLGKNVYPLGKEPKVDSVLYLACDDLLETPDAEVGIEFALADATAIPKPNASEDLTLAWEYFDGKRWRTMGRSGPRGNMPGAEYGFHDGTHAFSQTGTVSFRRPPEQAVAEVNTEEHRWIRVRIEKGNYGRAGTYTLDNDKWVFKDEKPLQPPAMRQITFRYREDYRDVKHALSFNDFAFTDVTEDARTEYTLFQPFTPKSDESPTLYLGFADKLPNESLSLYIQMAEELGMGSLPEDDTAVEAEELTTYRAERAAEWESQQRVVWEYYNGSEWSPLVVADGTSGFTTSGFIDFVGPDDWQKCMKFTEDAFWFRARLEMGGYVKPPRIRRVLTNVVDAHNQTTIYDEILGSSDATPLQRFKLLHGPLLEDEIIEVRERQPPAPADIEDLGDEAVRAVDEEDEESEEVWVRYKRVDSFYDSGPKSRHYLIDYQTGEVEFGDGRKGMMPPEGQNNIIARAYHIGGGRSGNVNPGTVTSLTRSIAYIDSVNNPLPGAGGADRETVAEAKERAPHTIKSRDRAVTAEDFEMMALRASTTLARAKCVPDKSHRGAVTLVVVPKAETEREDLTRRLVPSNEVLRYVKRYLDDRRLVGTVLQVIKPRYRDLSLKVTLLRRTIGTSDRVRGEIERKLRRYLHPLVGGRDASGWEFGRAVLKTELIHVIEEVPRVDGVDNLEITDEERRVNVEHVRVDDDELPFLIHVHVVEKVRDEIM